MAHQIKNPLQAVAMNLEVIRMRVRDEAPELWSEIERHGEAVDENVSVLDRRVRMLLRLGRRSPDEARESVDVARLIDDFAAALQLGEDPPTLAVRTEGAQLAARARPGYVLALVLDLWRTVRGLPGEAREIDVVVGTDGERVVVEVRLPDLDAPGAARERWERTARVAGGRLEADEGGTAVRLLLPTG
jgi:signal transduction histidine kinase